MRDIFHQVKQDQEHARTNRVLGDHFVKDGKLEEAQRLYKEALDYLEEVAKLFSSELKKTEERLKEVENQKSTAMFLQEHLHELASQLADTYGMMGGIYRRLAAYDRSILDSAIAMYDRGREYELNPLYEVSNSYNLTNSIAMRILKDPLNLEGQKQEIQDAIAEVEAQVEGERKYDWWAWADLGELHLLNGEKDKAFLAYDKLKAKGARVEDYDVIRKVLQELEQSLQKISHPNVKAISSAIQYLLNRSLVCFISYSQKDEDFAERLSKDLSSKGVKCWNAPYDLYEDYEILPTIKESDRENDKLILILSQYFRDSEVIRNEVEAAREKEKQQKQQVLFPICLDDIAIKSLELPNLLASNVEDFTRWKLQHEYQIALSHLLNDLKTERVAE